MAYDFYLAGTLLPVPPQKMTVKIKNRNKTVNLINDGEVNILKSAGLTELDFDAELPQVKYPYADYGGGYHPASYYLSLFEQLKVGRKPFRFIVTRMLPSGKRLHDTNMAVSLEEYEVVDDVKQGFDLSVKIKLKQYRSYGTKTLRITGDNAELIRQRSAGAQPDATSWTVQEGDTVWTIAKARYGDAMSYDRVLAANRGNISDPNSLTPGTVLTLP